MAEIRVEPQRRSLAWLWVLLALAVVAAVAWYLMTGGVRRVDDAPATTAPASTAPAATPTSALPPAVAPARSPATLA